MNALKAIGSALFLLFNVGTTTLLVLALGFLIAQTLLVFLHAPAGTLSPGDQGYLAGRVIGYLVFGWVILRSWRGGPAKGDE